MAWYSSFFGGGSGGSSSGGTSIWGEVLRGVIGGLGAAGASSSAERAARKDDDRDAANNLIAIDRAAEHNLTALDRSGLQQRKTSAFEAELLDYFKQMDNQRKRVALDTYGQFNTMSRVAPGYKKQPPPAAPIKPLPSV